MLSRRYTRFLIRLIRLTEEKFIHAIRIISSPIRVLPIFVIVGAQKSGTTSLYRYLIKHPFIYPTFKKKEPHFFDIDFSKGLFWYRSFFPTKIFKFILEKICRRDVIIGEKSPYYILHPHVPKRLYSINQNIKIIILLRNPVDRTYSHYFHSRTTGVETLSFEKALEKEEKRINGEFEKIIENENYVSRVFPGVAYKTRSIYINQIKNWFKYFPKEQILIIRSEELFKDPQKIMNTTFKFLGIPICKIKIFKKFHSETRERMDPNTRVYLINYFKLFNQQLYKYLERDFKWDI